MSDAYAAIAAQLVSTQQLIQTLLSEIRDNSSSQASLRTELKTLHRNVGVLSNIIRDGDGNKRSLVSEVDVLKIADDHHEKRLTAAVGDLEEQISDLAVSLAKQMEGVRSSIVGAETKRLNDTATHVALQHEERKDLRSDKRQRLTIWVGVITAILALIGSTLALILK